MDAAGECVHHHGHAVGAQARSSSGCRGHLNLRTVQECPRLTPDPAARSPSLAPGLDSPEKGGRYWSFGVLFA